MRRRELYPNRGHGRRELHGHDLYYHQYNPTDGRAGPRSDGGDNGVDLDEDLTGTWTLDGHTVRFNQDADTFVRDAAFIAGPNTLSTEGTFGDTSLRLVLTKVAEGGGAS